MWLIILKIGIIKCTLFIKGRGGCYQDEHFARECPEQRQDRRIIKYDKCKNNNSKMWIIKYF